MNIFDAASALGLDGVSLANDPKPYFAFVPERLKLWSWVVAELRHDDRGHRATLEVLAKALGFTNLHELQQVARQGEESEDLEHARRILQRFTPTFALAVTVPPGREPSAEQVEGLNALVNFLVSQAPGSPSERVREKVAERLKASSWEALLKPSTLISFEALYEFQRGRPRGVLWSEAGHFRALEACAVCERSLATLRARLGGRPEFEREVQRLLEKQPHFIEAHLELGEHLLARKEYRRALFAFRDGLGVAGKLIPGDFEGGLNPEQGYNRMYLKLVWGEVRGEALAGSLPDAIKGADWGIKLAGRDLFGFEQVRPLFLAADGRYIEASQALEDAVLPGGGHAFVSAILLWLARAPGPAIHGVIEAVLRQPDLRYLASQLDPWGEVSRAQLSRGPQADTHLLDLGVEVVWKNRPSTLGHLFDLVLKHPKLLQAERKLHEIYHQGDRDRWEAAVAAVTSRLGAELAQEWARAPYSEAPKSAPNRPRMG